MSAGIDRARLQGTILSGRSVKVNVYGAGTYDGWFGLGYADERDREEVTGSRQDGLPIGMTAGKYVPGAFTLKFAETTAQLIKEGLAALDPNGISYGDARFTCTFSLSEADIVNAPVILYTFGLCAVVSDKLDADNESKALIHEFGIKYIAADQNGLTLFSSQQ